MWLLELYLCNGKYLLWSAVTIVAIRPSSDNKAIIFGRDGICMLCGVAFTFVLTQFVLTNLRTGLFAVVRISLVLQTRVAKYSYVTSCQNQENKPNDNKIYQMTTKYTKMTTKYTKWQQNTPNDNKIYQMAVNYANICNSFQGPAPEMIPKLVFWFENISSGNPATNSK
jgi:hypothetical protein